MSGKRLWLTGALLTGALLAAAGASGCGPWCERWCEKHHPVPAVPVTYGAAPCCQPCAPAPTYCPPGTVSNTWQRTVPTATVPAASVPVANGCYP
jgi:hypothetical protein